MAQPGWKTAMDNQQRLLASHQQRVHDNQPFSQPPPTTLTGVTPLTTIQENQDPALAVSARQPDPSSHTRQVLSPHGTRGVTSRRAPAASRQQHSHAIEHLACPVFAW